MKGGERCMEREAMFTAACMYQCIHCLAIKHWPATDLAAH